MVRVTGQLYSPQDYLSVLDGEDDGAGPDPANSFTGLLKPADDGQSIFHAHPSNCERWIQIDINLIEAIEHLGLSKCGDHSHPLVRLYLFAPESSQQRALFSLASLHQEASALMMASVNVAGLAGCPPGQHPCYDAQTKTWTCCPDNIPG